MQQELNWPILQQHRQKSRLALFYKAMQNTVALQIPHHCKTTNTHTRHHNHLSFIYPSAQTNVYMYSCYFPRTIKEWNSLTDDTVVAVVADSVTAFCNRL